MEEDKDTYDANTSVFSNQSAASVDTIQSSPTSSLGDTSIVSKKQIKVAKKQQEKLKKKAKEAEKRKKKNKISKDDYFQKTLEFRAWLSEEKSMDLDDLSPGKSKTYFKKFVKKWNKRHLPKHFYRGTDIWAAASPSTQSVWAMPSSRDVTPTSLPGDTAQSPLADDASFATFGKRAGRKALQELEKMRLKQLEKEAQDNMGTKVNKDGHVYAEPITPQVRRALSHGYDIPDVSLKLDKRDYDEPISPRPVSTPNLSTKISSIRKNQNSKLTPVSVPVVSAFPSPPPPPPPSFDEVFTPGGTYGCPEALPSPPPPLPNHSPDTPPPALSLPQENTFKSPGSPPPKPPRIHVTRPAPPPKPRNRKPPPVPRRAPGTRPLSVHVMQSSDVITPTRDITRSRQDLTQSTTDVTMSSDEDITSSRDVTPASSEADISCLVRRPCQTRSRPLSGNYSNIIGRSTLSLRSSSSGSSVSSFSSISSVSSETSQDGATIKKRKLPKQDSYCERIENASYVVFETLRRKKKQQIEKRPMTPKKGEGQEGKENPPHYDTPRVPPVPVKKLALGVTASYDPNAGLKDVGCPRDVTPGPTVTNGVYSEGLQLPVTPGSTAKPTYL